MIYGRNIEGDDKDDDDTGMNEIVCLKDQTEQEILEGGKDETELDQEDDESQHREVEKFKAWSYSRNCANEPVIVTAFIGLRGYMYNPIT